MIIDARNRPATTEYLASTINLADFTKEMHKGFGVPKAPSVKEESMELYWKEMDEAGIDLAIAPGRWGAGTDPIVTPQEVVRLMTEYPKRIYGAIAICAAEMDKSMAMIDKYVLNGPVRAVNLEPAVSHTPMHTDDKRIYPLYDFLQEKEIPVFLQTGGVIGPDISYNSAERLDKMLSDFPKLTVIDIHAGAPNVDGTIFCAYRRPNLYLSADMYLDNTPFCARYIQAANCMISNQFVFGTSYPFIPMKESLELWYQMGVKKELLPQIMCDNIARALRIDPNDYK
jgi:predicted TIM-barrel fold metal-dependent hydrolase